VKFEETITLLRGVWPNFKRDGFYKKHKAVITKVFTFLLFLFISILVLRGIIFSSSFIGFNHDWVFPMTNESLKSFCARSLFVWSNDNAGYSLVYPAENLFRYLLFPLSFLEISGLVVIQLVLLFVFTFSGWFMYSILRESFKLGYFPSLISGFFYTTTPVLFNKVAAGHIPYIIAYALSPIIMAFFIKYTTTHETKNLIITSLLLSFATIQIQFAVMLAILFFFYAILIAKMKARRLITTFSLLVVVVSLVHSFWLLPTSLNSTSFFTTLQGASSIDDLKTWGTSLTDSFRMIGYRSPHFETALSGYSYKYAWDIASFSLVILVFGSLLVTKSRIPLFFGAVSVVTLIFTTVTGPFSNVVFFLYSVFPIFNAFREVYHLAFLIAFSYSIMLAFLLNSIHNSKKLNRYLKFLSIIVIAALVVFNDPFIYSGNLSGQIQQYQLNDQNLSIIDGYVKSQGDYRVLYLPMVQPFKYDNLTYYGIDPVIAYSPKFTIGNYISSDFLNRVATYFYVPSSNLTNILKTLSVKYVFFRTDLQSMAPLYLNEGNISMGNGDNDSRLIWTNDNLIRTLANQQELELFNSTENLSVFENKDFLPHIYPATIPVAVDGNTDELFALLLSSVMGNLDNKAIFLSEQLNQGQWQFIKNDDNTYFADEKIINGSLTCQSLDFTDLPASQVELAKPPAITFEKVNPTKYEVKVENATKPFFLIFGENYNPQWRAYIEDREPEFNEVIASYPQTNVKEANHEQSFTPEDISYLSTKSLEENYHFIVNGYANAWYINETGTFTITLEFWPQNLFYTGLAISIATLILCTIYISKDKIKIIYKKHLKKKQRSSLNHKMTNTAKP
jgi:hypothetical protein